MNVLFLIVARGGSKGIPHKNLLEFGGVSLVGFKAVSARRSAHCTRLILSTDSPAIAENARAYGAEVPFLRPATLATDEATTEQVIAHAMDWIEAHDERRYDALMLLEPSSPFATHHDYDRAVALMQEKNASFVTGMRAAPVNSVFQGPLEEDGNMSAIIGKMASLTGYRRQDVRQEYTMNGAFYLMRWSFIRQSGDRYADRHRSYGVPMEDERSVELDAPRDAQYVRFLVDTGALDLSYWTEGGRSHV